MQKNFHNESQEDYLEGNGTGFESAEDTDQYQENIPAENCGGDACKTGKLSGTCFPSENSCFLDNFWKGYA